MHAVLIVDDSLTVRMDLGETFADQGWRARPCGTLAEARAALGRERFDLVVLDVLLPDGDGVELLREVRARPELADVPVMLLSSRAEVRDRAAGADEYVEKPYDRRRITARATELVQGRRSAPAADPDGEAALAARKLLAVDDSPTYLHALAEQLRADGYGVVTATTGPEAIEALEAQPIDLVLLDVIMPGVSGLETCARLKAVPAWRDTPVILLTARGEREAILAGLEAGADDYVVKDTTFDVLVGRVRAHLRRRHLQDENRRIRERLLRMEVAREQAERESRFKSRFLASMSHELRTPLNSILGFSEMLEQQLFGPLNEVQTDHVRNVIDAGRHLLNLVNDILDVSKIEAGRMELHREWAYLDEMATPAVETLQALARKQEVGVDVDIDPDLPRLYVDRMRLKQILYNLLSNAIKFTPAGGAVHLSGRVVDGMAEIVVRDTGIGIKAEDLPRLFREFEQLAETAGQPGTGTGLGLALTRRLVELHGGTIGIESEWKAGTRVTVRLPLAP